MQTYHTNKGKIVGKVFEEVFDKYDLMNDLMSFGIHRLWKKTFVNWLNPQKNSRLIDVASGTGDIASLFLDKIDFKGNVCCVDGNKGMIEISKRKFTKTNNIEWYCNNAEKLPFNNDKFDYYTISFGMRNVANINKALKEAFRVLKPGGRLLCLEFSKVRNETLNRFYQIYSKSIPIIGKFVVGKLEPYEYLINSIQEFYSQKELLDLLKQNNFTKASYRNLSGGIVAIHSAWKI